MKSIAFISSGLLRNYRFFIQSDLYRRIVDEFDGGFYISTWEEDGYGGNHTADYSSETIPEEAIRSDFGSRLKFLKRLSFTEHKAQFFISPSGCSCATSRAS
jgi:hypothetical protein